MKTRLTIIIAVFALTACAAKAPLSSEVVRSEMARNPEASYIDGLNGKLKWNYTTGLELKAMLDVAEASVPAPASCKLGEKSAGAGTATSAGSTFPTILKDSDNSKVLTYVDAWYDAIIAEDGTIGGKYKKSNYSTDHICPGRTLFKLYDITGKEKYRLAMDKLYEQIQEMPRTAEGGFWHKKIYPGQMWLDGLYMAQPFYAEYSARYLDKQQMDANFADIARQFNLVAEKTYDPATGLYRHAWDSTHEMFWCDKTTGQSAHAWGRALGWYAMALVDVLPFIPEYIDGREQMLQTIQAIAARLPEYADPQTGMWYQVLDRPGAEGNYVEASCSAMFTYALLKGCRLGYLDCADYARQSYEKLISTFVSYDDNGLLDFNQCCEVAGLGGKTNRSGDYTYYINERVRANDPKGIGPLIWASLEYEAL